VAVVASGSKTTKAEFVVPMPVAEKILTHISDNYFEHYACIAWVSDVQVVRGELYTG
jgi:nitrogen regulatory protein P-II 2